MYKVKSKQTAGGLTLKDCKVFSSIRESVKYCGCVRMLS